MTRGEATADSSDDHVAWDGTSPAVTTIRDLLVAQASAGALRLVLQQLTLHEQGRRAGTHESMDAIIDVGGNLVAVPIAEAVRADPATSARLDAALTQLRAAIAEELGTGVDSLEVIADADGTRRVMLVLSVEVSPQELADGAVHPALHGGAHHISHHAPVLDDLRDRVTAPAPGRLRQLWDAVRGRLSPAR